MLTGETLKGEESKQARDKIE